MRSAIVFSLVLLLCGLAAGQATVVNGAAGNWIPSYGYYAAPIVPLITTPSVSLATVSPDPVGARNATWGNVAGATNATLSMVNDPPQGVYTQPVFYAPAEPRAVVVIEPFVQHHETMHPHHETMEMHGEHHLEGHHKFDSIAGYQADGIAATAKSSTARKASKTYTKDDIDRMNQSTGQVKYKGKTEEMH
jgi:hypothetical protein